MRTDKSDIYTRITGEIIEAIALGSGRYCMPWHCAGATLSEPLNAVSKRSYRGINVLVLWAKAISRGYTSPLWATYNQWQQLGGQVQKGEKATEIVLWKTTKGAEVEDADDENNRKRQGLIARGFSVFNVAQVTGFQWTPPPELSEAERIEVAESFFRQIGAEIHHCGNRAFYDLEKDRIVLPEFKRFRSAAYYYSTLGHETIHWTGAPQRLDRKLTSRFGSRAYAAEELIGELGASFLGARFRTFSETRKKNVAYLASWLELLRHDKRALFTAASKAQQAVDWLTEKAMSQHVAA